jgi:hypothetical protein
MEDQYLEYVVQDAPCAIPPERVAEIEAWFDGAFAWLERIDPICDILDRLKLGGRYAKVLIDRSSGEIVFVNLDGSRFARTPEQIARLFIVAPRATA